MNTMSIEDIIEKVTQICKNNKVEHLSLFGSFATGTATPTSDIDFAIGSPRDTLRQAFTNHIIDNDKWLEILKVRNQLAHDYDGTFAIEKFQDIIHVYYDLFEKFRDDAEKYYK